MDYSQFQSIVVLTGAGISAESGIRTFRASDGLWEDHRIEDVATPEGFLRDAELVHRFYNSRRAQLGEVQPNDAHKALALLEQEFDGDFLLITQNVDNLHERAGSMDMIHMHGELLKVRCQKSGYVYSIDTPISTTAMCLCCGEPGNLRPDIVWFGEMPMEMGRIYDQLSNCDLFISIGTSGHVYPAAGFVELATEVGAYAIEVNLETTRQQSLFDEHRVGLAGEQVPKLVDQILGKQE
jgi:NAD-dependent deacetylase